MKFTRDSLVWSVTFVSAVLLFTAQHFGAIHAAFPDLGATGQARIELASAVVGFIAGWLKMSPLSLSYSHPLASQDASTVLSPVNSEKVVA